MKKNYIFLIFFLFICSLYFYSINNKPQDIGTVNLVYRISSQIQTASVNLTSKLSYLFNRYLFLNSLYEDNQKLNIENFKLKAQQQLLKEVLIENEKLRNLNQFYKPHTMKLLSAKVIAKDFLFYHHLITINRGSSHGVKKYMGVIHPKGVVGYVFRTATHSSQVITIFNKLSSLPAINQNSRVSGLIESYNNTLLSFHYLFLDSSQNKIKEQDPIVTNQTDYFPKGFPIGLISKIEKDNKNLESIVLVKPHVNFESLEEVLIIVNPQGYVQ